MNSRQLILPHLVLSRRIRKTPFEERVFEQGARAFTTYNHMPLASYYRSVEEDYAHLCRHVQIWDVSCERQVEVVGPDALSLVELATPRDLSGCRAGQCMYTPLVDERGGIVNDPVILRLAEDRFWISIADSGVLLWLKGIACGRGLDVDVFEPDVSPLAVQGPASDDLMAELLGEQVREIRFFRFARMRLAGTTFNIARSGWSGQGGFELYLEDSAKGLDLWDAIWAAGRKYRMRAGCPNLIDRIERGLFSYGSDMTLENNPYECGLDRFFEADKPAECISDRALARIRREGVRRKLVHLSIGGDPLVSPRDIWTVRDGAGRPVGCVTSLAYSARYGSNLAFATVEAATAGHGNTLSVETGDGERRAATVKDRFWS